MKVLDKGFITIVDQMGTDLDIVNAARISLGKIKTEFDDKDRKLLKYLWEHKHGTPFEMVTFKFHVKAPIFIARQWFRHRIASYNEISRRYTSENIEFHTPKEFRLQAESNKQASDGVHKHSQILIRLGSKLVEDNLDHYDMLIQQGVCREQARMYLPVNMYTEYYFQANLRSLINFISLRNDSHAQKEIRDYASAMLELMSPYIPETIKIVKELRFEGDDGPESLQKEKSSPEPI